MESHLLSLGPGYPMDPQTGGQMRPPYADLCRPPCTDATSQLSAYHGRYLPSMPLSTGSSFPFLGGMFTGSLPGAPTSPFRTPSTPGVNNMRQFWPPTPPPDGGYGRLALNANLFPLFGASPESGAFLTQGLVSRLGSTTHLSPLIDHKEHSFFSHGIGLGTPLTPTGHVTSPSPFPHLIPSLERHPVYGGHMTLGGKEIEDPDDGRLLKTHHLDCLNIPSSRPKAKHDGKNCCDNKTVDDSCCKLSQSCDNGKSHEDMQNISSKKQQLTHKVQPCKIEVSHSPTIKHDLLSPPIDSPRSDLTSPNRSFKKTSHSPFGTDPMAPVPVTRAISYEEKSQTRCSQCCANIKDVGVATKLGASETKDSGAPVSQNCAIPQSSASAAPVVSSCAPVTVSAVSNNASHVTCVNVESKVSYENESSSCSPVIAIKNVSDKQSFCKSNTTTNEDEECEEENNGDNNVNNNYSNMNTEPSSVCKSSNNLNVTAKHVTAAVIPTAPKQLIHRDVHPDNNSSRNDSLKNVVVTSVSDSSVFVVKEQKSFCTDHCVKVEMDSSNEKASNSLLNSTNGSFVNRPLNKNLATSCKVKDMIKNVCNAKQVQHNSLLKNSENFDVTKTPPESPSPKTVSTCAVSLSVSPTVMSKSPSKNVVKMQYVPVDNVRKCSPFKEDMPVMKNESGTNRLDCEFSQKNSNSTKWTKATVSPFTWQGNNSQDDQAMNLTVTKKVVKPEPNETVAISESSDVLQDNLIKTSENSYTTTPTSNVIGVCHPNQNPIAINKMKNSQTVSSVNNFSSISVLNQPASEQSTEVHILHRSSKSSFPLVSRNGASPVPLKSTISHVTANTSIHRASLKTEQRLMGKRGGKISEMEHKLSTGRTTTLATLAPKLSSKNLSNFGKDLQSSHTISASSSVSSTSIVFPATVNPCIPVGIAIAQQRQDSSTSASIGKSQPSVPSSTPSALSTTSHLSTNHVTADIQTQEIIRDQKSQDLPISNNATPVDTSLLVAQGPTIVSRQWESEALTRTAALPSSWVAHGSIVAPAVWLGQGAYTTPAAPTPNPVPNVAAMNSIESSPISLPPGGYQLARDSITGHLLLIPTANIELMDRGPSVWPTFNSTAGNLPIQQLVTQQQHTQFEQVLPQPEPFKTADPSDTSCNITTCDLASNTAVKTEETTKMEELSGQVPSVPLATGQTYAFTTFPTQCDPSGFSYVLQSSTVMHLAHTQTTASIQTESGRRSQATSPLHCATPSPPPNTCSVQVSAAEEEESENESDMECCENNQQQVTNHIQSVTTAIQVDMDSQTNSEEEEDEEGKITVVKSDTELKVVMSDSANQTESVPSESPKSEPEVEDMEIVSDTLVVKEEETSLQSPAKTDSDSIPAISLKEDSVPVETGLEIVTSETELAPSLPVENKQVMDFIDHHGLNLLVDSIEEFASREQETQQVENQEEKIEEPNVVVNEEPPLDTRLKPEAEDTAPKPQEPQKFAQTVTVPPPKSFSSNFKTLDTTVTDGLGLLCALAEQRFFEEALNDDTKAEEPKNKKQSVDNLGVKECSSQSNSSGSSICSSPSQREVSEMEMRQQIEELQKKYKQKQRELELLRKSKGKELMEEESYSQQKSFETAPVSSPPPTAPIFAYPVSQNQTLSSSEASSDSSNDSEPNKKSAEETDSNVPKQNVSSVNVPVHVPTQLSHSDTNVVVSNSSPGVCSEASQSNDDVKTDKEDSLLEKKTSFSCPESTFERNGKGSKTPFFDEQAWFVRRSERIFLSDAKPVAASTPAMGSGQEKSTKKANTSSNKGSADTTKEKKEHTVKLKSLKSLDETPVKKSRSKTLKPKNILSKKRLLSTSSDSDSSSDEKSSEGESSDAASCTSENLPLSTLVEHSSSTKLLERQKRLSTDSEYSSGQSDDLPLSVLLEQKVPELPSCILKPEDLQENARLLVLDEGLFYAGYITKSEDPDIYGILIDGDRAARPHMFSKEEILNAAVLEVKPSHKLQLPEGSRICAFWSQQYRCLYPGTVTKASSPLTDPSLLYVEFDDGDRGRIPLSDIRMLPSDFPIVSLEPNPFMILGKRRARTQSQNNNTNVNGTNSDVKHETPAKSDKTEHKKQKSIEKMSKKTPGEGKVHKEKLKKSKSPSAVNRSRSSSKSSVTGHGDSKVQNSSNKKESSEDKKKSETQSKHSEKKSKDNADPQSILKPKKHKKHKEDHHKHHHHHHKHHHHKKHKAENSSSDNTVINPNKNSSTTNKDSSNTLSTSSSAKSSEQEYDTFILENSKSDLTVKIKKSPSPHTNNHEELLNSKKKHSSVSSSSSSEEEDDDEPPTKKQKKSKLVSSPSKRKDRVPSVEKSKIAAFLPDRQLWRWSGKSFRRPGAKGKAKKEFYRSIQRGKETIKVGDCAVFLSTGRPHLPYIGRIETMWESWGGKMDVKVKWFYHPEETKSGKKLSQLKGALFQSPHFDENDVQTISHKCEVLSWSEYQQQTTSSESVEDNNDTYFLAGTYDPIMGTLILEPGVPNISNLSEP